MGLAFDSSSLVSHEAVQKGPISLLLIAGLIARFGPNTQQLMFRHSPALEIYRGEVDEFPLRWLQWQPTRRWAIGVALLFVVSVLHLTRVTEFLYFNF